MNNQSTISTSKPIDSARYIAMVMRTAIQCPEDYVVELEYADSKGALTHRTISPIRFVGGNRVLALCLCREQPRQFYLERCSAVRLVSSSQVLMPMPMG
jgi:predicted DNA-binding transcriptional regulator YafY